tara:strand:- start:2146 stop:2382 length:237 start_codon:yes stop_codon:yes gene_type:complete
MTAKELQDALVENYELLSQMIAHGVLTASKEFQEYQLKHMDENFEKGFEALSTAIEKSDVLDKVHEKSVDLLNEKVKA